MKPVSANSPQWKGKYYLIGYGWIWVNGWERQGNLVRLSLQDMTDEQARKFCQPRGARQPQQNSQNEPDSSESGQGDIPF